VGKIPLSRRIAYLRRERFGERGLTAFAKACDVSAGTAQRWERGADPAARFVERIWRTTGCDLQWLLTGEGEPWPEREPEPAVRDQVSAYQRVDSLTSAADRIESLADCLRALEAEREQASEVQIVSVSPEEARRAWQTGEDQPADYRSIPYKEGAAAAGDGLVVSDDDQGVVIVHRRCVPVGHQLSAVRLRGDSMEPVLPSGAIVVIDHDDRDPVAISLAQPESRRIVAARVGESDAEITVKFLSVADHCILLPANRAYSPRIVEPSAILGRVIFAALDLVSPVEASHVS